MLGLPLAALARNSKSQCLSGMKFIFFSPSTKLHSRTSAESVAQSHGARGFSLINPPMQRQIFVFMIQIGMGRRKSAFLKEGSRSCHVGFVYVLLAILWILSFPQSKVLISARKGHPDAGWQIPVRSFQMRKRSWKWITRCKLLRRRPLLSAEASCPRSHYRFFSHRSPYEPQPPQTHLSNKEASYLQGQLWLHLFPPISFCLLSLG